MMKCIFGMQRNFKIFYKLILPFGFAYPDMPKVPKIRSLHVYAISPEKHGVEVVLLPADKYESFLQGDSILDVCNQACPKYPK